jgi:hypothetical protein
MHLRHQRMAWILRAKNFLGDLVTVPGIDLLDQHDGQQFVLGVAQGNFLIQANIRAGFNRQRDRDGENVSVTQSHLSQHPLVVRLTHKATKGRKGTRGQQFQITHRPGRQLQ